jgi:8-oxo-dGTP pyrophosphatase MutT (NUDIX family)
MPKQDQGVKPSSDTPIRDAACVVLVDRLGPSPRLLLGRRRASQVFLPNKWVFPGGRVDNEDHALAAALDDAGANTQTGATRLCRTRLPFALAAIRELYEEAGVMLGHRATDAHVEAMNGAWQAFAKSGHAPACNVLTPLARAITPPGLPRRFDTWFFMANHTEAVANTGIPDGELLDLGWFTLDHVRDLDLPHITRLIVDDVASALGRSGSAGNPDIPFYFQSVDTYRRTLISASEGASLP